MVKGQQQWRVVGCYISLDDALTTEGVVTSIRRRNKWYEILVAGNFNADLSNPEGTTCTEEIATALVSAGLEEMINHFLPRRKPWLRDGRTWSMRHRDQVVRSQTDYLLGMELYL